MNLLRLRELVKAWQDGLICEAELRELREALPEIFAELETAMCLLGESDTKRFRLMKRNGELETIAARYEALRLYEERTPTFIVPCSCGHSSDNHWMFRWKCNKPTCQCKRYDKITSLPVPGDETWENSAPVDE